MHIRRIITMSAAPLMLLALSCTRIERECTGDGRQTTLSATIEAADIQSKTWLDSGTGGKTLSLYWSDGDRVNVNGQVSSPVSVAPGEKKSHADFSLRSVSAPYRTVYPAGIIGEDASYDAQGNVPVTLPSVQEYCPTSFASGTAVMCGYSSTEDEPVAMRNMCAAIRVRLVSPGGESMSIGGAKIISRAGGISGPFTMNPQEGILAAGSEASPAVELEMSPVSIGQGGAWFWFAVPAGEYPEGFDIFFTRESDRRVMQCGWSSVRRLEAGMVYTFDNVEFSPGAKDIETAEEWEEFVTACNAGGDLSKFVYRDGYVRIGSDIESDNFARIDNFTGKLDGQGHKITCRAAMNPLFRCISGEVRNLNVAGTWAARTDRASALADTLKAGGLVYGCANEMEINLDSKADYYIIGGLVRILQGGTVENCINRAALSVSPDCSAQDVNLNLGGIAAQTSADAVDVVIKGCSNTGALTVDPIGSGRNYGIKNNATGGIVAWMRNTQPAVIQDCENSGKIEYKGDRLADDATAIKAYATAVGGIVGIAAPMRSNNFCNPSDQEGVSVNIVSCRNSALIHSCAVNYSTSTQGGNKVFAGGIAGAFMGFNTKRNVISDSKNTGTVIPYDIVGRSQRAGFSTVASGFVGFGGNVDFVRDTVDCTIGTGRRPSVAMGGMIGYTVCPFSASYCHVRFDGFWTRFDYYKSNRASVAVVPVNAGTTSMGIAVNVKGSVVENCIIGARPYSSTSTLGNGTSTDVSDQSSKLTVQMNFNTDEYSVAGQGYTTLADDVKFSNVVYRY